MVEQPTGTVTLLFTDIEGSTRLLERLGRERYAEALDLHRRLLREAFERHGGYEVDSEGDAFFVAFRAADEAVAAAGEGQQALARAEWSKAGEIRVRIGVHTGEPLAVPPKYVGIDVHKAARIMAAGHGGQVLLSAATRGLLGDIEVLHLGEHRLKDLLQPEPLYQLLIEGLPSEFPALKTLGNRPTNLPVQPNPLIGRERELAEIGALLSGDDGPRLLTLTGVGGTGKTRLALQIAAELLDEFASGVYVVALAPISNPRLVISAVAQALAVREVPGEALDDVVASYLEGKQMLLLLDNFEQVVEAAPVLADLMRRCPRLRLLVTSRERLRVVGERVYAVPPLRLPGPLCDLAALAGNEAVALFVARASAAAGGGFVLSEENASAVAAICGRLEGLPLAIELAAAWVPALPPEALLRRLDHRLSLLARGPRDAEERQQTLHNTIAWSYDLLRAEEQALFARLAVFVDGCRLEAAEAVCDPGRELGVDLLSGLASLVEKNLVRQRADPDGEPRFWMFETVREFACEMLAEAGGTDLLRARHADYFLALVSEAYGGRLSIGEEFARVEPDQVNIQAALVWADERGDVARFAAAVAVLWRLWRRSSGQLSEGLRWAEIALARRDALDSDLAVLLLGGASELWRFSGDNARAKALKRECIALAKRSGSRVRWPHGELAAAHTLADLADIVISEGNLAEARVHLEESLALGGGARTLASLGLLALVEEDLEQARHYYEQSLAGFRAVGHDYNHAVAVETLGHIARRIGDRGRAVECLSEALRAFVALREEIATARMLDEFAVLAAEDGELERAGRLFGAAKAFDAFIAEPSEMPPKTIETLPQSAVETGRRLTLDEAVEYALGAAEDRGVVTHAGGSPSSD